MTSRSLRSGRVRATGQYRFTRGVLAVVIAAGALIQAAPGATASPVLPLETTTAAPKVTSITASGELNIRPVERAWTLRVKVSKAVLAGTLSITDGFGDTVRTIAVPKSNTKLVVSTAWDGRDDTDTDVPEDVSYTWRLVMPAKDGSGNLVNASGSEVTGTIEVVNTALGTMKGSTPKISDTTPVTGQTVKAMRGTWIPSSGATYTYQWYRDSVANEIANADGATYTATTADYGHTLLVKVSGVVDGWTPDPKDWVSAATAAVGKGTLSPAPTPKISGTPKVGETLTAVPGSWGAGVTPSFQWYRVLASGKKNALTGQTASTYVVAPELAGKKVRVRVTGSAAGYADTSKYSKVTKTVAKGKFSSAGVPTIVVPGTLLAVGETLLVEPGSYTPAATDYGYQWYRVKGTTKTAIKKATKDFYTVTSADKGYTIKVQVTGKRAGFTNAAKKLSGATPVVQVGISGVTPKLSNTTPIPGDMLSVTAATDASHWGPSGVTVSYAWYSGNTLVGSDPTYQVTADDADKAISVVLTGTLDDYAPVVKKSAATTKVKTATFDPDNTVLYLSYDGLHHILEASVAGPVMPDAVAWQWYTVNGTTEAIPGATSDSLDISSDTDNSGTYMVEATLTKAGYQTLLLTMTSPPERRR